MAGISIIFDQLEVIYEFFASIDLDNLIDQS